MKKTFSPALIKKYMYPALIILLSVVFLVSAGLLADYLIKSKKYQKQNDELFNMVQTDNTGTDSLDDYKDADISEDFTLPAASKYTKVVHPTTGRAMLILTEYAALFELNPDLVGWISISGTEINYPVMQTPEWVNYYLTRDFYGQYNNHGSIYVDESANVKTPSDNVTLYGHRMKDGSMFAALHNYKDKAFFEANSLIDFNTIFEKHTYKIISVFVTTATLEDGFAYHEFVDGDEQTFTEFVAKCKELSLYDTGVDAVYGDKLITLSTCDHDIDNGRLAVVAKRIS